MNSYQHQYLIMNLEDKVFQQIQEKLLTHTNYQKSKTENFDGENFSPDEDDPTRKSKGCFVDDEDIYNIIWELVDQVNCHSFWNFEIKPYYLNYELFGYLHRKNRLDYNLKITKYDKLIHFKNDKNLIAKVSFFFYEFFS